MIDQVSAQLGMMQNLRPQEGLEAVPSQPLRISDGIPTAFSAGAGAGEPFTDLIGGLVKAVDDKAKVSGAEVRRLMLGESDNIHRSMIAMQESGLAFSLLVEVRNKLVESYQELIRMPV